MIRFSHTPLTPHGLTLAAALAALVLPAATQAQSAPFTLVESGKSFARLQDAINAVGDGMGTIRISPGRYNECAVQGAGDITFAAAEAGLSVFEGVACEDKAALVLRGRSARIEGLVFAGIEVGDGNGAGIRLEKGNLAVSQSWFRDSQQGILTANDPSGTVTVDKSTFTRLGTCEHSAGCAHSIYVGDYGAVTVTRTRFEAGRGGHYLKTRAARIGVFNSSFDDSRGHVTNYMIDVSGGATGRISGNWFVQGRDKENWSTFIAVAAEGHPNSSTGLQIDNNDARFAPGVVRRTVFVANWSRDKLAIGQNALADGLTRYEER